MRRRIAGAQGAAGQSGGSDGATGETYVDDVFSTDVFDTELEVSNTITNGIDLAGEGGMIWLKTRDTPGDSTLHDSERGLEYGIYTTGADPHYDFVDLGFTKPIFSSDGYTTSTARVYSKDGKAVGWTFRKAPSFFDCVTWTGTGVSGLEIPHNLGIEPGMIIIKRTDANGDWPVYHISRKGMDLGCLNYGDGFVWSADKFIISSSVNDKSFKVPAGGFQNADGGTYVAYLFAHDDSDEGMIQCGTYTGTGDKNGPTIDLGWEPQFVMIKNATFAGNWTMIDTMRVDQYLLANLPDKEETTDYIQITSTGFKPIRSSMNTNGAGQQHIYMAIRRPNKPASEGFEADELFALAGNTYTTSDPAFVSGFPVDMGLSDGPDMGWDKDIATRLTGTKRQETNKNSVEGNQPAYKWDYMNGYMSGNNGSTYGWQWRRQPGFFDVVCYNGNGSGQTVYHNLNVRPEMTWFKTRTADGHNTSADRAWRVMHKDAPSLMGDNLTPEAFVRYYSALNDNKAFAKLSTVTEMWEDRFVMGSDKSVNAAGNTYIAYLFASVPGICDIGSFTDTGAEEDIDCGFTNGARFVLIKPTNNSGDWSVFDTIRGISDTSSPRIALNNGSGQQGGTAIKPFAGGFKIALNTPAWEYIYMAIA